MGNSKRYYWLKLKEDFFRNKKIKKLRKIAGGDTYALIYLEMQLLSLKNNGILIYENVEETFAEEIALEIDEDVENVKVTLLFLLNNGLLEEIKENEYIMTETIECIGSESASAERVRKYRALKNEREEREKLETKKALQCNTLVTNCNTEKRREELEIEIKKEQEQNLFSYLENNFARTISPTEIQLLWSWLDTFTEDIIKYAIDISCLNNKKTINYVNGILNNWKSKGYKRIEECKEDKIKGENKNAKAANDNEIDLSKYDR